MSILETIKKMLGIAGDYTVFDMDIIVSINAALFTLNQIGVGVKGFKISGNDETWDGFFGDLDTDQEAAKEYVYLYARIAFDPPSSSFVLDSMNKIKSELEWRLNVECDKK